MEIFEILASPYFTFTLLFVVTVKWIVEILKKFEFKRLGGLFARMMFLLTYAYVLLFNPSDAELRVYLRMAFQLLFIDEIINWAATKYTDWRKEKWSNRTQ